jgi:squalene-hopene/tetraprenyl-beta-curcumene cyclase
MEQSAKPHGSAISQFDPAILLRLRAALASTTSNLLAERNTAGYWVGELSSSPLSTATAITALAITDQVSGTNYFTEHIGQGLKWLEQNVNDDGGWGDTGSMAARNYAGGGRQEATLSNISTTALCWAAFGAVKGADQQYERLLSRVVNWLRTQIQATNPSTSFSPDLTSDPTSLISAIIERYGKDRTFSAPILTACALSGRLGSGKEAWKWVLPLPFELAAFPPSTFAALRLPVVSYALPALIAIGHARHFHAPSYNPVVRLARILTRWRALKMLEKIQPKSGGFLEATPLTSFVVMSLAGSGEEKNPVAGKGIDFLLRSQRTDGSWPIDTNLSTWVTTLSVEALAGGSSEPPLSPHAFKQIFIWLLGQQYQALHPYTHAAPGGWAWTDLPGGVPDADDTAGAVLALSHGLGTECGLDIREITTAAMAGIRWLLNLQNRDGGIPTFCRGWGNLPFDRSSCDITAHAIRAWAAWLKHMPHGLRDQAIEAIGKAIDFLTRNQVADGSWVPLWFGNQFVSSEENFAYGTARVLIALAAVAKDTDICSLVPNGLREKGRDWLLASQNADGGWGGSGVISSVEETALAMEALVMNCDPADAGSVDSLKRGISWLLDAVDSGAWIRPSPIGFYFAKLWYYERLYPRIFTVAALSRAMEWWGTAAPGSESA